jgi:hypothetical protein
MQISTPNFYVAGSGSDRVTEYWADDAYSVNTNSYSNQNISRSMYGYYNGDYYIKGYYRLTTSLDSGTFTVKIFHSDSQYGTEASGATWWLKKEFSIWVFLYRKFV